MQRLTVVSAAWAGRAAGDLHQAAEGLREVGREVREPARGQPARRLEVRIVRTTPELGEGQGQPFGELEDGPLELALADAVALVEMDVVPRHRGVGERRRRVVAPDVGVDAVVGDRVRRGPERRGQFFGQDPDRTRGDGAMAARVPGRRRRRDDEQRQERERGTTAVDP